MPWCDVMVKTNLEDDETIAIISPTHHTFVTGVLQHPVKVISTCANASG